MTLMPLYGYYKTGRFIFGLALLVAFQMGGLLATVHSFFYILTVYCLIAFIRVLMSEASVGHVDFVLDLVFISAIVHVSFGVYSYMTLFYLFPIFFSSIIIHNRKIFLYPLTAILFYSAIFLINGALFTKESLLNIALHAFSFFLISFAGNSLKEKMDRQEVYIKRLEEEQIRMKGYERLYRVSADLAHELRNPLAAISAAVQFMKEGKNPGEFVEMLGSETSRLNNLVNEFLMFSRPSDAPKEDVDMSVMVKYIIDRQQDGVEITPVIQDGIVINANRLYLEAALNNIIKNAVEAARSGAMVTLKTRTASFMKKVENAEAVLEVEDDGPGIDDSVRDRIFEPFFTTKQNGTGLGLAIAYRVITGFGGSITVDVSSHGGARMTVVLPL